MKGLVTRSPLPIQISILACDHPVRNFEKEDIYIRAIIYHTVPPRTFAALSEIDGVRKVTVETSEDLDLEPICSKCEVKVCTTKLSTSLFVDETEE